MGEYYKWVNIDKKEYITPRDFDYGNKFWESMNKDSAPLHALHVLLANEWRGDRVLWLGDERLASEDFPNAVIQNLYVQTAEFGDSGYTLNLILDTYRNVSCLFKEAEEDVREEIGYYIKDYLELGRLEPYNEYGIDLEHPYEGLFLKTGRRYKYTINHTKKVYYSLDETDILFQNNTKNDFSDPLPILMGYGRVTEPGEWLGDIIGVSDSRPEGYLLLKKLYMDR